MKTNDIKTHKLAFFMLFLLTFWLAINVLKPFIGVILMAVITVLVFEPIFLFFKERFKSDLIAQALTFIIFILCVAIPLFFFTRIVYSQILIFRDDVSNSVATGQFRSDDLINVVNNILSKLPGETKITNDDVIIALRNIVAPLGNSITQNLGQITQTSFMLFTKLIVYLTIVFTLLPNKENALKFLTRISPFPDDFDELYTKRITAMTISMVKGTFVIAIVQGLFSALFLYLLSVPYVAFWTLIIIFFSIIPVGAGFILVPISFFLILSGDIYGGVLLFLANLLVVTNIDNVLRPLLVSKDAKLNPTLTLISVLGGINTFGFLGVVYGPVIMILLFTTLEVYIKHFNVEKGA
jgi:predicted PurR-regulated permease PerM